MARWARVGIASPQAFLQLLWQQPADTQQLLLSMPHTVLLTLCEPEDVAAASHLRCWHDSCCPLLVWADFCSSSASTGDFSHKGFTAHGCDSLFPLLYASTQLESRTTCTFPPSSLLGTPLPMPVNSSMLLSAQISHATITSIGLTSCPVDVLDLHTLATWKSQLK